jgi:hypothetical protein
MEHKASHARVSDLALLALLATNELQKLKANRDTDCFYVAKLFEHLSAEIPDTSERGVRRLAPSAIRVYERAIHEATNKQAADLASLARMLSQFLDDLRAASQAKKSGTVNRDRLVTFLLSLHDQLITEKQRVISKRLSSRFRV